jgi:uncharacterized cupin superfamily protein
MPNIHRPTFEEGDRPEGFRSRRARIGYELGTERIGASLWELPPGEAAYPYHFHYVEEELVIVLSGRPSLRTPEGVRGLEQGEALRFPTGEKGAHQIFNETDDVVTFLAISSQGLADVLIYPDSDRVGVGDRPPRGGGFRAFFKRADAVGYFDGETPFETRPDGD